VEAPEVTGSLARRNGERGNAIVLVMIILTALGTLAMLTTTSVRGGMQASASDRFHLIARYAAESGGAMAMEHLRNNINSGTKLSAFIEASTAATPVARELTELAAHGALPGEADNPFSDTMNAWFTVEIFNNRSDTGYTTGVDTDARVLIRSTGHGPDNATAIVEWEVVLEAVVTTTPCRVYAMKNQSEDNSGTNPCLGAIDTSITESFTP
jgi:hypothetical protein